MTQIPTRWVTVSAEWGEGKKHLWSDDEESLKFHTTEAEAREHAAKEIEQNVKMVAVMEIKTMLVAKAREFDEVTATA